MTSSGSGMLSTGAATPSTLPQVTTAHALALLPTLYSAYAAGAATPSTAATPTVTPSGIFSYIAAGLMPPAPIGGPSLSPGGVVPTLTQPRPPPSSHPFHISNLTSTDSVKRPVAHLALPPGAGGESNIPI